MINPQLLELPMSRTNFHDPKDVRAIEVRLYLAGINKKETLWFSALWFFKCGYAVTIGAKGRPFCVKLPLLHVCEEQRL